MTGITKADQHHNRHYFPRDGEHPDESLVTWEYSTESLEQGSEGGKQPQQKNTGKVFLVPRLFASGQWMLQSSIFKMFKV